MELSVAQQPDKTTLRITGPVRLGEVPDLLGQVNALAALGTAIEIDFSQAEHLHCAAWQVLLALHKELTKRGQGLKVTHVPEAAREVMVGLLNLGSWLSTEEDVD